MAWPRNRSARTSAAVWRSRQKETTQSRRSTRVRHGFEILASEFRLSPLRLDVPRRDHHGRERSAALASGRSQRCCRYIVRRRKVLERLYAFSSDDRKRERRWARRRERSAAAAEKLWTGPADHKNLFPTGLPPRQLPTTSSGSKSSSRRRRYASYLVSSDLAAGRNIRTTRGPRVTS